MPKRHLTSEQREALRADYLAGTLLDELVTRYGYRSCGGVLHVVRDLPRRYRRADGAVAEGIRAAYLAGETRAGIAERFGVSLATVGRRVRGLPRRRGACSVLRDSVA